MIIIRPATAEDSSDLFTWRNDEQTRFASVSQSKIERADHDVWFTKSLTNGKRRIYIAELAGESNTALSVGMCRFDLEPDLAVAEVSINLNPGFRGRGLAGSVLRAAIERFRVEYSGVRLEATIRLDNAASDRIFTSSGFSREFADAVFGYYISV